MTSLIAIDSKIFIDQDELLFSYIRAAGPGGQNVNKVATAVQLRFDVMSTSSLTPAIKDRLTNLAGSRMTEDGVLVIEAKRYRTQEQNRADAQARLVTLIQKALFEPKPRHATRPSAGARAERLAEKKKRGEVKKTRRLRSSDFE